MGKTQESRIKYRGLAKYEFFEALDSITFRHPAIETEFKIHNSTHQDTLHINVLVPHRDYGYTVRVTHSHNISPHMCYSKAEWVSLIHSWLRQAWLHELDECFHVDDKRVNDPHLKGT